MFIKGIRRNYDKVSQDDSIADEDKIDALLIKLGGEFLVSRMTEFIFLKKMVRRPSLMQNMHGHFTLKIICVKT